MQAPKVLILDVASQDYQALADILQAEGYAVAPYQNPGADLVSALTFTPDLIILNIQTTFGLQRFRELKSRPSLQQVPVLFILERFDPDFAARCLEIGADDLILQPFHPAEVLARVAVVLKVRERELRLESVQNRYRRLFEDSPQGIFVTDQDRRLVDCNQALKNLLGYEDTENLADLNLESDFFYSPADYRRFHNLSTLAGEIRKN